MESIDYLTTIAKQSMRERDLLPDYPAEVLKEMSQLTSPAKPDSPEIKEMTQPLWFSLDNDNSRDLDQITYAEKLEDDSFKVYVAIADVDSLVKKGSPIDHYAEHNTTSVYTPTKIFSMLPEVLSTNLTSLNENEERLALVAEMIIGKDGSLSSPTVYRAMVKNHAKLAYNSVSAWLDGKGSAPQAIQTNPALDQQVRLQDQIAQILRTYRHSQGALTLETLESEPLIQNQVIVDIVPQIKNRGRDLIEDFMITANQTAIHFLDQRQFPSIKRVVKVPKRWDRIVAVAASYGTQLPSEPDSSALDQFLIKRRTADPLRFPDLSLTIIKLLGNGEYVVQMPNEPPIGHFSLAVKDYAHSTAPNRRFPDLITQRLLKSSLQNQPLPYTLNELKNLAEHCTLKEDDATKVERKMKKSAACFLLRSKINQTFDALVTGASAKGTWVRIFEPLVEGKLVKGLDHIDVGDNIKVKLIHVDIAKGFIDFARA